MNQPLLITSIMQYAETNHSNQEVVSLTSDGTLSRFTYKETFSRVRKLANALNAIGIECGDCVATLAWNDHRHFELYYGISCTGAICHTINPRLFEEQIIYIANHAEDKVIFFDLSFLKLVESLADKLTSIQSFIVMCPVEAMPESSLPNLMCYEELLDIHCDDYTWPDLAEDTASSLCYTSGTTGNPKGVLYSHRSNVLHSYSSALPDAMNLSACDSVLPVVPMFHANAWGLNYSLPLVGAKLVLPGIKASDPETLTTLMNGEGVTLSAGVPTVWLALLSYLDKNNKTLETVTRTIVGGAACPPSIMQEFASKHNVETKHAWGMTELSPLGTIFSAKPGFDLLSDQEKEDLQAKQGRAMYGIEIKITDDQGNSLAWDGMTFGDLKVRGNWTANQYFKATDTTDSHDSDGWFITGDVATISADGYMNIVDRTKDVIKSGGEWISSIELENIAQGHDYVKEASVIGIPDVQWTERPMLIVVLTSEAVRLNETDVQNSIFKIFEGKVAKWWVPEKIAVADELPYTATGKVSKLQLRKIYSD